MTISMVLSGPIGGAGGTNITQKLSFRETEAFSSVI